MPGSDSASNAQEAPRSRGIAEPHAIARQRERRAHREIGTCEMKAEVAAYWCYVRGMKYVGVESDFMDVMAANDSTPPSIVETEIKISLADLRADGNKEKHGHIEREMRGELFRWRPDSTPVRVWVPTRFMFAVPHYLHEKALPVVQDLYPYAGLLVVNPSWSQLKGHSVWVALRGKLIRRDQTFSRVKWAMREQSGALVRELGHGVDLRRRVAEAEANHSRLVREIKLGEKP